MSLLKEARELGDEFHETGYVKPPPPSLDPTLKLYRFEMEAGAYRVVLMAIAAVAAIICAWKGVGTQIADTALVLCLLWSIRDQLIGLRLQVQERDAKGAKQP